MSSPSGAQVCRISVVGPTGRADLAVPISTPVATLIPVLLRHAEPTPSPAAPPVDQDGQWVLQRLGDEPFDPDGTAQSLDWLEGEEFHLRPATSVLPALDFDDVADGVATVISGGRDHWRAEFNRPFFLALAAVAVVGLVPLLLAGRTQVSLPCAAVLATGLLGSTVLTIRRDVDRVLGIALGVAGCLFAGLACAFGPSGASGVTSLRPSSMLAAGLGVAAAAGFLLAVRQWRIPALPVGVFGVLMLVGGALAVGMWLTLSTRIGTVRVATILAVAFFVATIVAPGVAVRAARIRGPQLPRTADDLQLDIEPQGAAEVTARATWANRYLNVVTVSAALVLGGCVPFLVARPGWAPPSFVVVLSVSTVLRARDYNGVWQRCALALTGTIGLLSVLTTAAGSFLVPAFAVVLMAVLSLVVAAQRHRDRRPSPFWGHVANIVETITAVATLPLVLQLFGVFAFARGLGG
jgi:type VII secretion integral membrane protein EccD